MKTTKAFLRQLGPWFIIFGCSVLQAGGESSADTDVPVSAASEATEELTPELESRRLVRSGRFDEAEERLAKKEGLQATQDGASDISVALELWGMAQEARNEARSVAALDLAVRAKRRLAKAAKAARTQEDVAHIAQLRYELTLQFPLDKKEVEDRQAERAKDADSVKREINGGGSK